MSKAQLVITAAVLEGRSKSEVAREYEVSRYWVQQLVQRYETEGAAAFEPHSRRPHHNPRAVGDELEERLSGCARPWTSTATTPAQRPSPNTSLATAQSPKCLRCRRSGGSCRGEASWPRSHTSGPAHHGNASAPNYPTSAGRPT